MSSVCTSVSVRSVAGPTSFSSVSSRLLMSSVCISVSVRSVSGPVETVSVSISSDPSKVGSLFSMIFSQLLFYGNYKKRRKRLK